VSEAERDRKEKTKAFGQPPMCLFCLPDSHFVFHYCRRRDLVQMPYQTHREGRKGSEDSEAADSARFSGPAKNERAAEKK
jgi:hypothetical protein